MTETAKQKIQQRTEAVLMGRLHSTLKTWNKAEARRNRRAANRVTTHPKERRAMAFEALKARFGVMAKSPGGILFPDPLDSLVP